MTLSRGKKIAILQACLALEKLADLREKLAESENLRIEKVLAEYAKEYASAETVLTGVLQKFLKEQLSTIIKSFTELEELPVSLAELFTAGNWDKLLIDAMLPPVAQIMGDTAFSEMERLGLNLEIISKKSVTPSGWVDDPGDSSLEDVVFAVGSAEFAMGFLREYPEWMKKAIQKSLQESFQQEYWKEINKTTLEEIESILLKSIYEGKSIYDISKELEDFFISDGGWALGRAKLIARTEIGHVLNAARSMSMDALIEEAGLDVPMKKQWRSVLGTTTRDSHANLDGVPADSNNQWYLGGVYCRWPGDFLLPAKERCNCQCTLVMAFGLTEEEAKKLISEYSERIALKSVLRSLSLVG